MTENVLCSRADAIRRLIAHAATLPDKRSEDRGSYPVIYLSRTPLHPGEFYLGIGYSPSAVNPHADGSWVAMVDLYPDCNWGHPCMYLFLDPDGSVRELRGADWFPGNWEEGWTRITTWPFETYALPERGFPPKLLLPGGRGAWHLSRATALELVRDALRPLENAIAMMVGRHREEPAELYLSHQVAARGEFKIARREFPAEELAGEHGSWVAWLDPLPTANWAHPCWILFVDRDGQVRVKPSMWFPENSEQGYELVEYKPSAAER